MPGPSAPVTLLSAAGEPGSRFLFEGFLPHRAGERRRRLRELRAFHDAIVLFESPRRIRETLADIAEVMGKRRVVVGRELTMQCPSLKNLIRDAIEHKGFSFLEVISDCTEIYGRKNDLGESPEMVLSQKAAYRSESYGRDPGETFFPGTIKTGRLHFTERPEYGAAIRGRGPEAVR